VTTSLRRESSLSGIAVDANATVADAGVVLEERPFRGHFNVRGRLSDDTFRDAFRSVLDALPPERANRVSAGKGVTMYWLGPDEWLLVTDDERHSDSMAVLRGALAGGRHALTEISGGQTVIRISGPNARDAIAHGCPLDIHPRVFASGHCAQTVMAQASVLIHCVGDGTGGSVPIYDVIVRRSFARYLVAWLADAASEYGVAVTGR
jgi:sarcosine oxidase subunit gamma